jgi:hypothetical protein
VVVVEVLGVAPFTLPVPRGVVACVVVPAPFVDDERFAALRPRILSVDVVDRPECVGRVSDECRCVFVADLLVLVRVLEGFVRVVGRCAGPRLAPAAAEGGMAPRQYCAIVSCLAWAAAESRENEDALDMAPVEVGSLGCRYAVHSPS